MLKQWVIKQYEIQKKVPFREPLVIERKIPVFVYWNNGINEAPYIVKQCVERLKERLPGNYRLHFIDDNNINCYVKIPEWMYKVKQTKVAHFSDYLRLVLLYTYGGVWIDSTVLVSKKFTDWIVDIENKLGSGIAIPSYNMSKSIIGNWFIFVKEKYNYCISWMLRILNVFWMNFNDVPDYFFFHVIFQIMWIDEKFHKLWSESPVIDAQKGVFVFKHQNDASVNYDVTYVLNCSPIHKLTYKKFDKLEVGMLMPDFINFLISE